jgi:hypothetical protein
MQKPNKVQTDKKPFTMSYDSSYHNNYKNSLFSYA